MRRFRFSLEAVLRYRRTMEELRRQALAGIQQELVACEATLAHLAATMKRIAEETPPAWDTGLLLQREQYQQVLAQRIAEARVEREQILGRMDAARKALVTATKERKAVERVRERHYQRYLKEVAAEEQKLLDDVGSTHVARAAAERLTGENASSAARASVEE